MAQVASNSDPKFSKGGGNAKKQQGKPTRESLDDMIKQLKTILPHMQEEVLERVLEKNNFDIPKSVDYIMEGHPIPTESVEWQQVTRTSKQETKAKPQDKRTERDAISEKKDKGANRTEFDKRGDRDDKRGDGRPDRKPKRPDARFKQEGLEGTPDAYRAPRDRDSKTNGSPNSQSRPRKSPAPVHAAAPGTKPVGTHTPQPTHPTTQNPLPPTNQNPWGPPGVPPVTTAPSTPTPAPAPTPAQSQAQPQQPTPPSTAASSSSAAAPTRPAFSSTTTATSYSKIVQGKPQPTPPPQQVNAHSPSHTQSPASTAAATAAPSSATTPSTSGAPGKQSEFQQSPSGSRQHNNRASPTWRPKDPASTSSPTLNATAAPAATPSPAQSTQSAVSTPPSASVSVPATQTAATPSQQAAPVAAAQAQPSQPTPAPQAAQPAAQVAPAQPAPISPPTATTQTKRQPVVVSGGNVIFPPSLQYADNLSIQFGSIGLENKPKDLVFNFGTQPTNTPTPAATQPIQPPAAQTHLPATTTTPPPQAAVPAASTAAHVQPQQAPAQSHPSHAAAATHSPHSQHVSHQPGHPHAQAAHLQQHIPSHLPQQLHMNGDPNLGGHLEQSDIHQYPSYLPPYFAHMPTFGFSEGNPDELRRYYEHPTTAGYAPADSNTAQSAVPQNSQSPPPNSPSQYPMPYYSYPYMHPGYYQASAPSQFQQFPGNYIYGYNRMGGAGGYPPAVHSAGSPSAQGHSQYDENDYSKYLSQQQSSYSNFYSSPSSAASASASQQGSGSSVTKPAQSFSPTPTGAEGSKDYNSNKYRAEPSSFYNNLGGQQPHSQPFSQHHQPHSFMQQHIGGPQSIPSNQSSAYHHSPQPLSNQQHVQGQSGGSRPHYSAIS